MLVNQVLKMNKIAAACGAAISCPKGAVIIFKGLGSCMLDKVQVFREVLAVFGVTDPGFTGTAVSHDAVTW